MLQECLYPFLTTGTISNNLRSEIQFSVWIPVGWPKWYMGSSGHILHLGLCCFDYINVNFIMKFQSPRIEAYKTWSLGTWKSIMKLTRCKEAEANRQFVNTAGPLTLFKFRWTFSLGWCVAYLVNGVTQKDAYVSNYSSATSNGLSCTSITIQGLYLPYEMHMSIDVPQTVRKWDRVCASCDSIAPPLGCCSWVDSGKYVTTHDVVAQ